MRDLPACSCAILRYSRLSDKELLKRLTEICAAEKVRLRLPVLFRATEAVSFLQVKTTPEGLEALLFTSEGDMRQAINNLQSTWSGFGIVSKEAVFKVCDQPHPELIKDMLKACQRGDVNTALDKLDYLWVQGYAAVDIVSTIFRVTKSMDELPEYTK